MLHFSLNAAGNASRRDENGESGKPSIEINYRCGNEREIDQDRSDESIDNQRRRNVIKRFNTA
jgi:hypothetical protein